MTSVTATDCNIDQLKLEPTDGTVFRINSGNYHVQTDDSGVIVCKLRGNLKKELVYSTSGSRPRRVDEARKRRSTDPIAVGDRVKVNPNTGTIDQIYPRKSGLSRTASGNRGQHLLVANIDSLFIVIAAKEPPPDTFLIDRFAVIAEAEEIEIAIIVNKMDTVSGEDENNIRSTLSSYQRIGYPVHFVSAKQGHGIERLRVDLHSRISGFAGQSGVGKSSLLNALQPGLGLKVGKISESSLQGRHTTTSAELIPWAGRVDTWIADTPGLRQVEFWQIDAEDIERCFPEFQPYLGKCKFNNCRHIGTDGCAIDAAVDVGDISSERYKSYVAMVNSDTT